MKPLSAQQTSSALPGAVLYLPEVIRKLAKLDHKRIVRKRTAQVNLIIDFKKAGGDRARVGGWGGGGGGF